MKIAEKQQLENNTKAITSLEARVKRLEDMMKGHAKPATKIDYQGDVEPSNTDEKSKPDAAAPKKTAKKTASKKK